MSTPPWGQEPEPPQQQPGVPPPPAGQPPYQPYGQHPYGQQQPYGGHPSPYQPAPPTNGMAIASLVVSIVSALSICLCGITGLAGIVGAILGHVSRKQIRDRQESGGGMALAGVIVGWISFALALAATALIVGLIIWGESGYDPSDPYDSY